MVNSYSYSTYVSNQTKPSEISIILKSRKYFCVYCDYKVRGDLRNNLKGTKIITRYIKWKTMCYL